jgi:hypothetical protein
VKQIVGIASMAGAFAFAGLAHAQVEPRAPLEATTADGDRVRLFPDGRWEYVDAAKRAAMPAAAPAAPNQNAQASCPPGWQGGLFGVGRCIAPGDPQYNRGSLGRGK